MKAQLIVSTMIFAGSACLAGDSHYTAVLAQPIAAKKGIIANGNLWRCDATACVLTSTPLDADSMTSCRQLQRQVGALTAYGREGKAFDADKLAKCNAQK